MDLTVIDADGNSQQTLGADIEIYQGFVPLFVQGQHEIDVQADEGVEWTITAVQAPAAEATTVDLPMTVERAEPDYVGMVDFSEDVSVSMDHDGDGEFFIKRLDSDGSYGDQLLQGTGNYATQTDVDDDGMGWILITGSEEYEVSLEVSGN